MESLFVVLEYVGNYLKDVNLVLRIICLVNV